MSSTSARSQTDAHKSAAKPQAPATTPGADKAASQAVPQAADKTNLPGKAVPSSLPRFALSIFPLKSFCQEIVPDPSRCVLILPPGLSPHTYEPKPSDFAAVQNAARVFYVSPHLDGWASRIPGVTAVRLIDAIPRDALLTGHDDHGHGENGAGDHAGSDGHDHGAAASKPAQGTNRGVPAAKPAPNEKATAFDPHVWLDPTLAARLVDAMAREMAAASPAESALFTQRATAFKATLAAKDKAWDAALAPVRSKPFVIYHPFLDYFVAHYHLNQVAKLEPFPGKEPSPRYLKDVIAVTRKTGAKVIFVSPQIPKRAAEAFAQATGARIVVLDDIGGGAGRDSYVALMAFDVSVLAKELP